MDAQRCTALGTTSFGTLRPESHEASTLSFESPRPKFTHVFPKLFSLLNANVSKCIYLIAGFVILIYLSLVMDFCAVVLFFTYWYCIYSLPMSSKGIASDWRLLVLRSHASRFTDRMSVFRKLWEKQIMQISKCNAHPHMQVHSHAYAHTLPCLAHMHD